MQFRQETVFELFSSIKSQLIIPDYQRAFSWEDDQYEVFFNDLQEQSKSEFNYFFGNILVEENNELSKTEIVDGQQRLTAIVIFINSLINVLEEQKLEDKGFNIEEMKKIFIKNNGKLKLVLSKIDQGYFEKVILENGKSNVNSRSQTRMKRAKQYFIKKIKSVKSVSELKTIYEKLKESIITITTIDNKIDSTFMFELQNNRGIDITEMEQTKAYLMYQIYINGTPSTINDTIEAISKLYEKIYLLLNDINIDEDYLLWYHCQAYYGYFFNKKNDNEKYEAIVEFLKKEHISKLPRKEDKLNFIVDFVKELKETFSYIYEMEKDNTCEYLKRLKILGINDNDYLYPIIINGYRYMDKNKDKDKYLDKLFHICELLSFRLSIISSHGNVKNEKKFDEILSFEGDLEILYNSIKQKFTIESERWTDDAMEDVLNGEIYNKVKHNTIHYIFKVYEHKISGKEYPKLTKIWIEHISPQKPEGEANSGYELTKKFEYSNRFKLIYLHCLGNLMLSTEKQQHILGNKTFSEKYKIYKKNDLELQHQKEIDKYFENPKKAKWGIPEIENRHSHLIKVIMDEWSFKSNDKNILES